MSKVLMFALVLGLAAPATAQISFDDQPAQANAAKANSSDKLICQREDTLGSRLGGKKVCLTAEQWQEQKARHREQVEKFQQQNTSTGVPAG